MASTSLILLSLIACSAVFTIVPSTALPSAALPSQDKELFQESVVDDPVLGKVYDEREVDGSCRFEKNTNTMEDGSTNIMFIDYENGLSVILSANATNKCFVRKLQEKELEEGRNCKAGAVTKPKGDVEDEKENYEEGEMLTQEEREKLPARLQFVCEDRDMYWLVTPAATGSDVASSDDTAEARQKRSTCFGCWVITRYRCHRSCNYWVCSSWECDPTRVLYCGWYNC